MSKSMTNILKLPDGTFFYVNNGCWNGYITSNEEGKRVVCMGIGKDIEHDLSNCINQAVMDKDGEYLLNIEILNNKDKEYDLVLRQRNTSDGLTRGDIYYLMNIVNDKEMYPMEIAGEHAIAMGFISVKAAEKLSYDYKGSGLEDFIVDILNNLEKETIDFEYEFKGISIRLDY